MGSWLYAFLMPKENGEFEVSLEALARFETVGLELDVDVQRILVDDEGHCEPRGSQFALSGRPMEAAYDLLSKGLDLLLTWRNSDVYMSVTFARKALKPHIMIGWSTKIFKNLSEGKRKQYLNLIASFAKETRSSTVVIVSDPPGYFEERIINVDDTVLLALKSREGRTAFVHEIWVEGVEAALDFGLLDEIGSIHGFIRNRIILTTSSG